MLREAIGIGDTEELAKEDALHQLGLDNANGVEFEIIKKAEKKRFGLFGGSPAKVKAIYDESDDVIIKEVEEPAVVEPVVEEKEEVKAPVVEVKTENTVVENVETVAETVNGDYSPAEEARK